MEKEHLEMILEDINVKFDLVLEGYAVLDRKMGKGLDRSDPNGSKRIAWASGRTMSSS